MYRRMLFSVAAVLLLCPLAFGVGLMDLYQDFGITTADTVQRVGEDSSAILWRHVEVEQDQEDTAGETTPTELEQEQEGELLGFAMTSGIEGKSTVTQIGQAGGVQDGTVVGSAAALVQGATLVLGNDLKNEDTNGCSFGKQEYEGKQEQEVEANPGETENEQEIEATQGALVKTDTCASGLATQGLAVSANQTNVNDPCYECSVGALAPSFTLDGFLTALQPPEPE